MSMCINLMIEGKGHTDFRWKKKIFVRKYVYFNTKLEIRCQTDPRASNKLTGQRIFRDDESEYNVESVVFQCMGLSLRLHQTTIQHGTVASSHQFNVHPKPLRTYQKSLLWKILFWPSHRLAYSPTSNNHTRIVHKLDS